MTSRVSRKAQQGANTGSGFDDAREDIRQDSLHSSRLGSFVDEEPTFDSQASSDTDSEIALPGPSKLPVCVAWQDICLEVGGGILGGPKVRVLSNVSGYAEPRSVLAIVGPAKSGKSALVKIIGQQLHKAAKLSGSIVYNGQGSKKTKIQPTFFCATDEPLANVTVEQALIYTALLQMPDTNTGALEEEVRLVCQRLGLLGDLARITNGLDVGIKRRLTVACQMICCSSLLVMHDTLHGIQEGDALAIMRAVHDLTKFPPSKQALCLRSGCTSIVVCQQPTTDICGFFTRAYILVNGELVYFGDTGSQAANLLMSAGMPCPPLYSPVEQYMRLIDPSFEVYLQAQGGTGGPTDDWNARFSSMMFKVLQGSYMGSALAEDADRKAHALASASYEPVNDGKRQVSALKQCFVLCRRLVTQGLQGLPLYLGRIIFCVIIALVYGGSYWKLNYSFLGAQERTTVLFLTAAVLPALAVATLPFYTNGAKVFVREHKRCKIGVTTHLVALFTLTLPHLAVATALAAVAFIFMVDLNDQGSAWGYFILNATLAQMCSDAMMLCIATVVPYFLQNTVGLGLLLVQAIASGFFPGSNRGFNLPVSVVSFTSWSYKGLLKNEFLYRENASWGCPPAGPVAVGQEVCTLSNQEAYQALLRGEILSTSSRWISVYVLCGIYGFWALLHATLLVAKTRSKVVVLSDKFSTMAPATPASNSPLYSNQSTTPAQPVNGHDQHHDSPV